VQNQNHADMKTIQVTVKPNSRTSELEESDGIWLARVKSPPVDGKANKELLELIAEHFNVPRSRITIKSGAGARIKRVQISN
jgi:uncharacterized protein (TIGR00251 family)